MAMVSNVIDGRWCSFISLAVLAGVQLNGESVEVGMGRIQVC